MHRTHTRLERRATRSGSPLRSLVLACLALAAGLSAVRAEDAIDPKYAQWVEELANTGPVPEISVGNVHFNEKFDLQARQKVVDAWRRLNAELEFAFPAVLAGVGDKRFCLTAQSSSGRAFNAWVGFVCSQMVGRHLSVHEHYMWRKPVPRTPGKPALYSSWHWSEELRREDNPAAKSLLAAQIAGFEWAIAEQKREALDNSDHQAIALECLQRRLDELKRSGKPIKCSVHAGEKFTYPLPKEAGKKQRDASQAAREQALRKAADAVRELRSPNEPPQIEEGRLMSWPAGYDRERQEKVVQTIRGLNLDIENSIRALVDSAADRHYCVTLEGEGGSPRNLTVGQLCCELLAENVNVYRPYLRDPDPKSYKKWVQPTAEGVAEWGRSSGDWQLIQIQHAAFQWALKQEHQGLPLFAGRQERAKVTYLQFREAEHWECRMPIIIDYLETRRVLMPPKNAPNEKAPDGD